MNKSAMNKQAGVGLAEFLITLLLATMISTALMRYYLTIKQQYNHIQTALEQSIDLQMVTDLIRNSTRMAGFTPCLGIEHLIAVDRRNEQHSLHAIELGSELRINRMSEQFDTVLEAYSASAFLISSRQNLHQGQSILIADCFHAEVQIISEIKRVTNGQIIKISKPLSFTYIAPIYVGEWIEESYFIRSSARAEPSLFYQNKHAEELSPVIHDLSTVIMNKQLMRIILTLDKGKKIELFTRVRIP